MKIISFILTLLINLTAFALVPSHFELTKGNSKSWEELDRPEANFILDIIKDPNSVPGSDSVVFVATGAGYSMGYNTFDPVDELKWRNSVPGHGGSSSIAIDIYNNIWMTTGVDSFVTDANDFFATGTGVHMSPDSGKTWVHYPQPGLTPIQGITYDTACDQQGGVWMACWGQSLQKLDSIGQSWKTLTCDHKEWDPFTNDNQKMFSVHVTKNNNLWVGTAEGINLCSDYAVADSLRIWKQFTYSDGLSGNFVTSIASNINSSDGKEYVFAASWFVRNSAEITGVSFTNDNGVTWNKCLLGEKVISFGFHGNDVYACGENGLWKSSDNGNYWEKYSINAWSDIGKDFVKINEVYSFLYQNDIMFAGTGKGLAVSGDDGNTWALIESYEPAEDSSNDTYAYPNPFSPEKFGEVKLQFRLKEPSGATCRIYNFAMEKLRTIKPSENYGVGENYLTWDGRDDYGRIADNGVYFYIISSGDGDVWNKIIIFE